MRKTLTALASAAVLAGCQTITEEMPNRPSPIGISPGVPVIVVPVPIPTPANPTPTPPPDNSTPAPPPDNGGGQDIPNNTNPVARLTAKIYFVECQGQIHPSTISPVGCRIHLDVTPTDASNRHTQARGTPQWTYSNTSIVRLGGNSPYNPVLDALAPGSLVAYCEVDGIRSNDVRIEIRN
ncbi:MAG TPA: hypothetical protein VJU18_17040 [Vicinamibacteria bacterium]|nr:hypothetical protein [Vicinamibacteria bacterium]